jgi:hypothetical protein
MGPVDLSGGKTQLPVQVKVSNWPAVQTVAVLMLENTADTWDTKAKIKRTTTTNDIRGVATMRKEAKVTKAAPGRADGGRRDGLQR